MNDKENQKKVLDNKNVNFFQGYTQTWKNVEKAKEAQTKQEKKKNE